MHGANRLGGNSLSDLLVFGRRAGLAAAEYAKGISTRLIVDQGQVQDLAREMLGPFERTTGENPFVVHADLQTLMERYVGIVRSEADLYKGLEELEKLRLRAQRVKADGSRLYNPGWHMALDLKALLCCSEALTRAARERRESRGGHTRLDYPEHDDAVWGRVNVVVRRTKAGMEVRQEPLPAMPAELQDLLRGGS
jgi:succinate dehydrogenase / fumarate reductase flavoprotein subunit